MTRIVDLSITIRNSTEDVPESQQTVIEYSDHREGAAAIEAVFGVKGHLLKDGEGWAVERFTNFGTHNSTHVDAPWHYNSRIQGEPAQTIDELPLEQFYGDGVVVDVRHKRRGDAVSVPDLEHGLAAAGHTLKPGDIVLVRTGCDQFLDQPDYMFQGCGVSGEATAWLVARGVRTMGIDAWGWDVPLDLQAEDARIRDEAGVFWRAHQADLAYSQIERLCNLGALPLTGFKVACFPLKIERGSGGPCRAVAIVDD